MYIDNLSCSRKMVKRIVEIKILKYIQIKPSYGPESYISTNLTRSQRCSVTELRTGILSLALEVGTFFKIIQKHKKWDGLCGSVEAENESHFLYCSNTAKGGKYTQLYQNKKYLFTTKATKVIN